MISERDYRSENARMNVCKFNSLPAGHLNWNNWVFLRQLISENGNVILIYLLLHINVVRSSEREQLCKIVVICIKVSEI